MRRPLFMVCLCLVIAAALYSCLQQRQYDGREAYLQELHGETLSLTGRVYQKDANYFYLESVQMESVNVNQNQSQSSISEQKAALWQQNIPPSYHIMCKYENQAGEDVAENAIRIGSNVTVCGIFYTFDRATNPGEFDMAAYYHSLKICGTLQNITVHGRTEAYSAWREGLAAVRASLQERLYRIFPEKEASVMSTMLLGQKAGLDGELKGLYQRNGIVHILSISGLHITIIGMSIYKMLRRMGAPVWLAAVCGGIILLLYGVMTGLSVSACRAIGMYLLRMLGEVLGRTYDMLTALGMMAVIMVWSNPGYLINAGFQLSFGAVLGVGVLYPVLLSAAGGKAREEAGKAKRYEESGWRQVLGRAVGKTGDGLKQSMMASLAITLTTLPILLWFYYEVPVYSMFLNLLILPLMSALLLSGLLAMLVPGLGILGTVTCAILGLYEGLCRLFEELPFHTWNPGRPSLWQVALYYGILAGAVAAYHFKRGKQGKWAARGRTGKLVLSLTMAVVILSLRFREGTTITFLDVGQGDCICIRTAGGANYLFDCGSSSRSQVGRYILNPYLKYEGIRHLDAVFVSHPDSDHYNGVLELLQAGEEWGITADKLVLPQMKHAEKFAELEAAAETDMETDIKTEYIGAGEGWRCGEVTVICLHPPRDNDIAESNASSQCFYVEIGGKEPFHLLLTGDVEGEGEQLLLEELRRRQLAEFTVLKVAHHGSKNATSEAFLEQVRPELSVISCGKKNRYGHPHRETLERLRDAGSRIVTTAEHGAITIEVGEKITVYGYR